MPIAFTIDYTGTPDEHDNAAALYVIDAANAAIESANEQAAHETPPGEQQPLLPKSTAEEIKRSYLAELQKTLAQAHESYCRCCRAKEMERVQDKWHGATDSQRTAALAALG